MWWPAVLILHQREENRINYNEVDFTVAKEKTILY